MFQNLGSFESPAKIIIVKVGPNSGATIAGSGEGRVTCDQYAIFLDLLKRAGARAVAFDLDFVTFNELQELELNPSEKQLQRYRQFEKAIENFPGPVGVATESQGERDALNSFLSLTQVHSDLFLKKVKPRNLVECHVFNYTPFEFDENTEAFVPVLPYRDQLVPHLAVLVSLTPSLRGPDFRSNLEAVLKNSKLPSKIYLSKVEGGTVTTIEKAWQELSSEDPKDRYKDSVVIIGSSEDRQPTLYQPNTIGPELIRDASSAVSRELKGKARSVIPWLQYLILSLGCALAAATTLHSKVTTTSLVLAGFLVLLLLANYVSTLQGGPWIEILLPILGIAFTAAISSGIRLRTSMSAHLASREVFEATIVLFDLQGSTSAELRIGTEKASELKRKVIKLILDRSRKFGGLFANVTGDGALIVFRGTDERASSAAHNCAIQSLLDLQSLESQNTASFGETCILRAAVDRGKVARTLVGGESEWLNYNGHPINRSSRIHDALKTFDYQVGSSISPTQNDLKWETLADIDLREFGLINKLFVLRIKNDNDNTSFVPNAEQDNDDGKAQYRNVDSKWYNRYNRS